MGFSDLAKKLSKLGQDTKNGVQKVSDSVSISNRISQEKKSLQRLFALIGEAVYKENPNAPKAGLEDEWAAVKVAYANIAAYTEQLNHVKGIVYCPNCGRPAAGGDKFCAKCGFKLGAKPETTGQKVAKDLKEAGQEVGRIAGDAADRTGEAVGGAAAGTKNVFTWLKEKLMPPKKADGELPEAEAQKPEEIETPEAEAQMQSETEASDAETETSIETPIEVPEEEIPEAEVSEPEAQAQSEKEASDAETETPAEAQEAEIPEEALPEAEAQTQADTEASETETSETEISETEASEPEETPETFDAI